MQNIKLILEYDGSEFFGFQRQPRQITIQEVLEKALSRFYDRKVKIKAASGRTDAGVHAECQVVNFLAPVEREPAQIQKALNALLPKSVAVREVERVRPGFHARYSARSKTYEYRVWNNPSRSPLRALHAAHVYDPLNLPRMRRAARLFLGRHDFKGFSSSRGKSEKGKRENTVRAVKKFEIQREGSMIFFRVSADGFLYHMVRNMVGAVLDVGKGRLKVPDLKRILRGKDRRLAPAGAPAQGLRLLSVTY